MSSTKVVSRKSGAPSTSVSPRKQLSYLRDNQGASPRPEKGRLAAIIPSSVAGQVRLYDELASPKHKHADSPLHSKFLSNSITDLKALVSSKNLDKEALSPKVVRHTRVKTLTNEDILQKIANGQVSTQNQPLRIQLNTTEGEAEVAQSPNRSALSVGLTAYRDGLRRDYENSPAIRVDQEAIYYDTIRGLDECGKCWASVQKNSSTPFKLKCKMPKCSNYQRDYPLHKIKDQGPVIKNEAYETFKPTGTVGSETTMKTSFQPFKGKYSRKEGPPTTLGPSNASFFGRTSYNSDFYNLGSPKAFIERYPQAKTAVEGVGLEGKSNYKTNFGSFFESKGRVTRWPKQNVKSPFPGGIPFLSQTTSGDFFKPFKTAAIGFTDKGDRDYASTEAFPNQFQSTYTKDYNGQPEWKCPAKVFMEKNLPPRMNHLKAEPQF